LVTFGGLGISFLFAHTTELLGCEMHHCITC